jgi:16S rRNA (guanine966-N2)-methyltransferase
MFSILTSLDVIEGAEVADLFAGSGALGIEALSRRAARATFVDSDHAAIDAIRHNLGVLPDGTGEAVVVHRDALRFAAGAPFSDVVLADPPYRYDGWVDLLAALASRTGLLVAESSEPLETGPEWETVKVKRYGGTVVTVARPVARRPGEPRLEGEI